MSATYNRAAWIHEKGGALTVGPSEIVQPGPGEILVQNHAWGINPIDWKIQAFGVMLDKYPAIFGFDIAGEVVAFGEQTGDQVMAHPLGLQTKRQVEDGFQLFTIVQSRAAVKLPDSMRCAEGAKLPLGILTASAALYNQEHLRLPLPDSHAETAGITLLIWGGSSNVGIAAIQLARASGVEVVTVASERNWEVVREAGAAAVVDQNDPDVVNKVAKTLQSKTIIGAFDAIGSVEATRSTAEVLAKLGGGKLRSVFNRFADIDQTVEAKQVQAVSVFLEEPVVGRGVWEDFLPGALERGQVKALLKTAIAGKGLGCIQAGIDMVKAGVSGTKVVVVA